MWENMAEQRFSKEDLTNMLARSAATDVKEITVITEDGEEHDFQQIVIKFAIPVPGKNKDEKDERLLGGMIG